MTHFQTPLRSQRLRLVNHQGDALRLGMNWTEEDLGKPQVLVDSADGMGHPGTFHFRGLVEEVSNGVYEAGGKPGVFTISDDAEAPPRTTAIVMQRVGARFALDVNMPAVRQARIRLSSKLLRLARTVRE